jgi:hypothetical protein
MIDDVLVSRDGPAFAPTTGVLAGRPGRRLSPSPSRWMRRGQEPGPTGTHDETEVCRGWRANSTAWSISDRQSSPRCRIHSGRAAKKSPGKTSTVAVRPPVSGRHGIGRALGCVAGCDRRRPRVPTRWYSTATRQGQAMMRSDGTNDSSVRVANDTSLKRTSNHRRRK